MLNVYRVTDCDWYAAYTFEQAKELAAEDMGCDPEDTVDWSCATGEPEPLDAIIQYEETGGTTTVRESLEEMTEPGWFAGHC